MSVVKINAVDVDPAQAPVFEERFAKRAGAVENQPGFEAFELLRPTGGATTYYVYTRWASEDAYQAWLAGDDFARAHAHVRADAEATSAPADDDAPAHGTQPAGHGAQLLAFEVIERVAAGA
jgi:heme oxygenase (mycobilin-producing)